MGIVKKQSGYSSILSYVGIFLGLINTIWLFPQIVGSNYYGLFQLILAYSIVFSRLSIFGGNQTVLRFRPFFKHSKSEHQGFTYYIFFVFIVGFSFCIVLYFLLKPLLFSLYQEKSAIFLDFFNVILPLAFFISVFELLISFSYSVLKTILPSFLKNVLIRFWICILIIIYSFKVIDFHSFMKLMILGYMIVSLILLIHLYSLETFTFVKASFREVQNKINELIKYGFFAFINTIVVVARERIDMIMIGAMLGLSEVGIFSVAFFMASVVAIPSNSISAVVQGILVEALKNKDYPKVLELYRKTSLNQLIISGLIFIGIMINLDSLFQIFPEYREGIYVLILIGFARIVNVSTGCNGLIIINSKFYKWSFYSNVFLVILLIITNLICIPIYGITGAALATLISIVLGNIFNLLVVYFKFEMNPFSKNTFLIFLLLSFIFCLGYFSPDIDILFLNVAIKSLFVTIVYVSILYYFELSQDVNEIIDKHSLKYFNFTFRKR